MRSSTFDSAADAKKTIKQIVKLYKIQYSEEYELLKKAVAMHREALADPKFAKSDKAGQGMRALYEISETLQAILIQALNVDQTVWFKTVDGGRWFAKTFGEFALPAAV